MTQEEVDNLIDKWHDSQASKHMSLAEYLGWTEEEFSAYVTKGKIPAEDRLSVRTKKRRRGGR